MRVSRCLISISSTLLLHLIIYLNYFFFSPGCHRSCVEELVEQQHAKARELIDFVIALEASTEWPYTLNVHYFQDR